MKLSIKQKLLLSAVIPLCLLGAIVIIIANTYVKNEMIKKVEQSLQGTAIATLAAYDQNSGSYLQADNGDIWKGSYNISQSDTLVDTIKANSGMDVTFFYGDERIMTSALDANGDRILGSPAGETIVSKVLEQGENYFSKNTSIDGTIYYGYYVPVYQSGETTDPIGMVFVGVNKKETSQSINSIVNFIVVTVFVVLILCIVLVLIITSSISNALKKSIICVEDVSSGRLNVEVEGRLAKRTDEVGDLARSIDNLQTELRKMIGNIGDGTKLLQGESDTLEKTSDETFENLSQVKSSVDAITQGADKQAQDVRNASDQVNYMGNLIMETGSEASDLGASAENMKTSSDRTSKIILELKEISGEVQKAVDIIGKQVEQTNDSAQKIKTATELISNISDETNLLSLNASIEAARAGEAGRGFAVVAAQIQKLAEQSNEASGQIDEIVGTLIEDSELSVNAMNSMQDVIQKQNLHIEETGNTINEVMGEIRTSVKNIEEIEYKTKELEKARKEIVDMIATLSSIAQENAASTEESCAIITEVTERFQNVRESAQNVRGTADTLSLDIDHFTV